MDFAKFRVYIREKYGIDRAFIFIGYVSQNQSLYTELQKDGYILVFKPTLILPDGSVKGNVDAELVLHAMIEYANYEKALIVSGDGDFYCLVEYLAKNNKLLKLLIPNTYKFSSLFRNMISHMEYMNNLKDKLRIVATKEKRGITAGRNPLDGLSS